ncbi:D-isomer specific 2-hydroxyacid dehydrogenase [Papiliotrema laurentii]|uniref:D-isomer specific 2-hydroxyacid dehydrogenase n=1 Tax=Papiliotrema laurentii TaxID=5418 RepID=A0AAD9FTR6_PAPLA|nr:D-isomer specific 2-hydroxyacid dehydrogenase [Papiliotrema laurentii]
MLQNLVVTAPVSAKKLAELEKAFAKVSFHPHGEGVDKATAEAADAWYTTWTGLPKSITSLDQVPNTKIIQLSSAGANDCLSHAVFSSSDAKDKIKVCSASGIHALCIPQYVLCNVLALYMKLNLQAELTRTTKTWQREGAIKEAALERGWSYTGSRALYGKTVGLLGYGHIARETARLFKAFHCRIIAATSNGSKRPATGYEMAGLGDQEGALPEKYFSTRDPAQLAEFASQCDVLISVLPSTPQTKYLFTSELFAAMPKDSIFVNVGRGDLAKTEDILHAVDRKDGLLGAVLDVTDPEPLPPNHVLFTHPRIIVTPHTSGSIEGYFDQCADVLLAQQESVKAGKGFINVVDVEKGY